jgi:hypothetical protein
VGREKHENVLRDELSMPYSGSSEPGRDSDVLYSAGKRPYLLNAGMALDLYGLPRRSISENSSVHRQRFE